MSPFLQLAIALSIIIFFAKLGGYLSYRIGQPAVLGELIAGIILGPTVIDLLHLPFFTDTHLPETIKHFAEVGVLLLMFLAGLDLHVNDLLKTGKVAGLAGILGMLLPLAFGTATGLLLDMGFTQSLFIGLIISATSVSISAQTLMEMKVLRSRVGISMLGAAVVDDILVLLGLSIFTAIIQPSTEAGFASILWIIVKMLLFLAMASLVGRYVFPRLSNLISGLHISQGLIAFSLVVILFYGWAAETLGQIAAITGAFLAGIWLSRTAAKDHIHNGISIIAYGFFVPVFFVDIGLSANARQLTWSSGVFLLVILLIAIVGKILGAGAGALWGGLSKKEALQLGAGMISRGEVGLIVAAVGIELGMIDQDIFSAIVVVVILTTLITPPALRLLFRQKHPEVTKAENPEQDVGGAKS